MTALSNNPKTIEEVCRAWRASEARLNMECIEAGEDQKLTGAACDRCVERNEKLFAKLQKMAPVSDDDIQQLIWLSKELLDFSWENSERVKAILQKASLTLTDRIVTARAA